jgi:hypothetical protein
MKQHLIFCCCSACKLVEMKAQNIKLRKQGHDPLINLTEGTIEHGDEKWRFIIEIDHYQLLSSVITSWRQCGKVDIPPIVLKYLETHTGRS